MYKKVTKNLLQESYVSDTEKSALNAAINDPVLLKNALSEIFDSTIKKEINKIIVSHAESVFISTAISQNGRFRCDCSINNKLKINQRIGNEMWV